MMQVWSLRSVVTLFEPVYGLGQTEQAHLVEMRFSAKSHADLKEVGEMEWNIGW